MNLNQITERNRKFQQAATKLNELVPGGKIVMMTSDMIRSAKKIDAVFPKLLQATTEMRFSVTLEKVEEEIDDVLYTLDRLSEIYRVRKFAPLGEFIQYGYDLMGIYSMGCDKIISSRVREEEL